VSAGAWTQPAYESAARLLQLHAGLAFRSHRCDDVERGIRLAMEKAGVTDVAEYCRLLEAGAVAFDDLVAEVTVGETYFLRDPVHFEFIRREAVPEILRRRGPEHVLRVWSAGCASGEEAYSLAMLLEEEGLSGRARILATDISRAALAKARVGVYGPWSLRGSDEAFVQRHFRRSGGRCTLHDHIRPRVMFEYLNLALDSYPSLASGTWGMDLILCRNVLIYFEHQTVGRVARRLFESLADGGWLMTGPSDPPVTDHAAYETVVTAAGVFYRRRSAASGYRLGQPGPAAHVGGTPERGPALLACPPGPPPLESATSELPATPASWSSALSRGVETGGAALAETRNALAGGEYGRVVELTRPLAADVAATALRVRALANLDVVKAEQVCAEATKRHPLSAELHYLHAVLLVDRGRDEEAARAVRRAIYLDRSLAVAHFTLGSILRRRGDLAGARRAYRNVRELCLARPRGEPLPLADGEPAGRLAEAAAVQLDLLDAQRTSTS
jgi:chemotaxis protein methyltransferase CheR